MTVGAAHELIARQNDILTKREFLITDIDPEKHQDRILALQLALRGKTVKEYFDIVDGLFEINSGIVDQVMDIGEQELGIDWN